MRQAERARRFYDEHSELFLAWAGPTIQSGLLRAPGRPAGTPEGNNRALALRAGLREGDRVLDAGCGLAGPAVDIARAWPRVRIEGVTVSPTQVRIAGERVEAAGLADRVAVGLGDYHALPFEAGTFDLVWYFESTGYSDDLPRLFAEAFRVLKPGGRLYVKDAFRAEDPLSEAQARDLAAFDALWAARTPRRSEAEKAVREAGFVAQEGGSLEGLVGYEHMRGAMVELRADGTVGWNAYGERFRPRYQDLPITMGELRARRPA